MPLPHKNADNEYLVHTDGLFGTSKKQEQYKLQIEELENEKNDLYTEMLRLQKGFSYLICFKELIDFETENPNFWDDYSQTYKTCKANAQGICEIMDFIEKNPKYDIEVFKDYYLPYLTNESTRFIEFEGHPVGTLKTELEEAAKDLYFKKRDERETKKEFDVFTLGAEYATSWFNNAALKLEEAKVDRLKSDIKIVKDKIRLLQRGFSYLIYYKDLIDFENTNPRVLSFYDDKSHTHQICTAIAQVICETMDSIQNNPYDDIETLIETLRQAYDCRHFKVPYNPPKGIDGVFFHTMWTTARELNKAVYDLITKRERETGFLHKGRYSQF